MDYKLEIDIGTDHEGNNVICLDKLWYNGTARSNVLRIGKPIETNCMYSDYEISFSADNSPHLFKHIITKMSIDTNQFDKLYSTDKDELKIKLINFYESTIKSLCNSRNSILY